MENIEALENEFFETIFQFGPGDLESTKKAFQLVTDLPEKPHILDIGCGKGRQTFDLAGITDGHITAVDISPNYLHGVELKAQTNNLKARISTVQGDMSNLNFPPESFDLIWSEGSAYLMGFSNALNKWRPLLKKNGSIVISDIVWFKENPPQEIVEYWANEIPDMKYSQDILPAISAEGFTLEGYFDLPAKSWWTNYYHPVEARLEEIKTKYPGDPRWQEFLDAFQLEIDMHRRFSEFYGYGFYIMKKSETNMK